VVERRQASAPAAEGRRKPALSWRDRTRWCGHEILRLSAFRFPLFLSFVLPFVLSLSSLPGLTRQSMRSGSLIGLSDQVFANRTSSWTTGSSPVVTRKERVAV
jgi:hypothetical protein